MAVNRFAKSYTLTCKKCGMQYTIPQNEYIKLTMKVIYRSKLLGKGNMEVVDFLNLSAGCCEKPDYDEKVNM